MRVAGIIGGAAVAATGVTGVTGLTAPSDPIATVDDGPNIFAAFDKLYFGVVTLVDSVAIP